MLDDVPPSGRSPRTDALALYERYGSQAGTELANLLSTSMFDLDAPAVEHLANVGVELEAIFREHGLGKLDGK